MNAKRSHPCHLTSGMHWAIQLNRDICVWPPYGHPQNPRIYRENKDRDATKLQFFLWHKCIYAGIGGHQDLRDGKHKRKDPRRNLCIVSTLTAPFSIWWLRTAFETFSYTSPNEALQKTFGRVLIFQANWHIIIKSSGSEENKSDERGWEPFSSHYFMPLCGTCKGVSDFSVSGIVADPFSHFWFIYSAGNQQIWFK